MRIIYKIIIIFLVLMIFILKNLVFASMADYTDSQADEKKQQEQQEWKKEVESRINKSSNNYLKSLSVKGYELSPEFDKQTVNYEIQTSINEDFVEINAETDDDKSSVSGIGKIDINEDENNCKIDVIAENGTVRSYFIKIVRHDSKNNKRLEENKQSQSIGTNVEVKNELIDNNNSNNNSLLISIIIFVSLLIVIIVLIVVILKKKRIVKWKN